MSTLQKILEDSEQWSQSHKLYLSFNEPWALQSKCLILASSDGVPDAEVASGFEYVMGMDTVQDVVANAQAQLPIVAQQQLLEAFLYYYDNDAFIDFAGSSSS